MSQYTYVDSGIPMTNKDLLDLMKLTRNIVSEGLKLRSRAGIKVRQPISKIAVHAPKFFHEDFIEIIKDAVNVKEVIFVDGVEDLKDIGGSWFY